MAVGRWVIGVGGGGNVSDGEKGVESKKSITLNICICTCMFEFVYLYLYLHGGEICTRVEQTCTEYFHAFHSLVSCSVLNINAKL